MRKSSGRPQLSTRESASFSPVPLEEQVIVRMPPGIAKGTGVIPQGEGQHPRIQIS